MDDNGEIKPPLTELETLKHSQVNKKRELSPVLSNSNLHKKTLQDRKKSRSRVGLLKKFKSDGKEDGVKNNFKTILNELQTNLSGNCTSTERLIRFKELEKERRKYLDDLCVRQSVVIENSICKENPIEVNNLNINVKIEEKEVVFKDVFNGDNKVLKGFCTGSGKDIVVSPENLKKHSEMFSDIFKANDCDIRGQTFKDFSFLQTSISDTQLLLAADVALSKINVNQQSSDNDNVGDDNFRGFSLHDCDKANDFNYIFQTFLESMEGAIFQVKGCSKLKCDNNNLDCSKVPNNSKHVIVNNSLCGFQTASFKPMQISASALKRAQSIFDQINEESSETEFKNEVFKKPALPCSLQKQNPKEDECKKTEAVIFSFENNPQSMDDFSSFGFKLASNKPIKMSSSSLKKAQNIFSEMCDLAEPLNLEMQSSSCKNSHQVDKTNEKLEQIKTKFCGFQSASNKPIKMSSSSLNKARNMFNEICEQEYVEIDTNLDDEKNSLKEVKRFGGDIQMGFSSAGGKPIKISGDALKKAEGFFEENNVTKNEHLFNDEELFQNMEIDELDIKDPQVQTQNQVLQRSAKKRLGVSRCKQLSISNDKLKRAKLIFDECETGKENEPKFFTSTPLKNAPNKPGNVNFVLDTIKETSLTNANITPVKAINVKKCYNKTVEVCHDKYKDCKIVFREQTKGGIDDWSDNLDKELIDLQKRMKVIVERKAALEKQKQLFEKHDFRRQRPGVLFTKKQSSQRIPLEKFLNNRPPLSSSQPTGNLEVAILDIQPSNAHLVHFSCQVINTEDGVTIIPNCDNLIGLAEIKVGFENMLGVDPKLLPKCWIDNHFKWIVWKLASLERSFPDEFLECLSVENVVQQLKYRYDREIDRAERSALRKILEKDDVPQKRMVLCVSDIIRVSESMFELELTDGWYSIRTLIDKLLSKQILNSKIKIGTKLITHCAEILNCDGCHPLDVPNHVKLKIYYNCTRLAKWYLKLGYQKLAEPFPIKLTTVLPEGGLVGCVKICIVRVYPLRFMEKIDGKTVWRNKKAEEKRDQEWTNKKMQDVDAIRHKVLIDYQKEMSCAKDDRLVLLNGNDDSIKEISSPKVLYQMLENTNDPDGLKTMLSNSQVAAAMDYKANIYNSRQQAITNRISEEIQKLKRSQRDVISVLRLRIIDASLSSSEDSFFLTIWKPTEDHFQLLQEESIFYVYNLSAKQKNNFTASVRTHFKRESTTKNFKFQRQFLSISKITQSSKISFNEFDTVGTVVQVHKRHHHQELWLVDFPSGRLLLVRISERPAQCCLLDNLSRGQNVAIINLIYSQCKESLVQTIANQYTIVTSYPNHKHVQDGLSTYCDQLSTVDLNSLLNECDKKIEVYTSSFSVTVGSVFDDSSEENTLMPSRLTTTDVAMSLIDMDQFFNI